MRTCNAVSRILDGAFPKLPASLAPLILNWILSLARFFMISDISGGVPDMYREICSILPIAVAIAASPPHARLSRTMARWLRILSFRDLPSLPLIGPVRFWTLAMQVSEYSNRDNGYSLILDFAILIVWQFGRSSWKGARGWGEPVRAMVSGQRCDEIERPSLSCFANKRPRWIGQTYGSCQAEKSPW